MKNVDIVIGLNYGDEGKGGVTNFLAKKAGEHTAVVRFNSGAQAGHTVEVNDKKRHIFHQFGSGTFVGAPTVLSRFVVVNPILFVHEAADFAPDRPIVFVDPTCMITTPYDVFINQRLEITRGANRHGSCGLGFNETIERNERGFPLTVADMYEDDFEEKVKQIRDEYFPARMEDLAIDHDDIMYTLISHATERFLEDCEDFLQCVSVVEDTAAMEMYDNLVFEGSQGLSLDQHSEDFPHVTRSSTGLENVSELLTDIEANINVHYVTRSYLTRHGAGPMKGEYKPPSIVVDKTNVYNPFQLGMRYAKLDYERMERNVERDIEFLDGRDFELFGVITCCDQYHQVTGLDDTEVLINRVASAIGTTEIITTWNPTDLA